MISNVAVIFKVNKIFHNTLESVLYIRDKVFKNGLSKICGRQTLKNLKWSAEADHITLNFL